MKKPLRRNIAEPGPGLAVVVLCSVQFVDVLGVTELVTALPRILSSLSAPRSAASLVLTAYAMCFGGLLMFGSRLGDRYGHRRTLILGIVIFGVGSLVCATAGTAAPLVCGRCLQGAAAAISVPATLRLLTAATPRAAERRRALSIWSAAGAAAGAAGYVFGGGLTELAGWRAVFWINLPIAILLAVGVLGQTADAPRQSASRLDFPGAVLLTAAVMGVVLAASELQPPGHLAAGLALMPFSLCVIAGSSVAAAALKRLSEATVIALGLWCVAAGDALLGGLGHGALLVGVATAGVGLGLSSVAATSVGTGVPEPLQAAAAGVLNTAAQLGTALGVAALLLVVSITTHAHLPLTGARLGWAAAAALAVLGATAAGLQRLRVMA